MIESTPRKWTMFRDKNDSVNACQNVIVPRARSDEYFWHFWKCGFLTVRDIFEEIRSKYVNYSNIGGALCRDIRQSAESYRINMKKEEEKKKKKGWYGKRWRKRNEDLFAGSLDYSERTKFERNEAVDAVFHWTFVSKWKRIVCWTNDAAIAVPNLSDLLERIFSPEYTIVIEI